MDEKVIEALVSVTGCCYDDAEKFLESESGCYADIGGRSVWLSGALVRKVAELALTM